jgi:hypothetical protein
MRSIIVPGSRIYFFCPGHQLDFLTALLWPYVIGSIEIYHTAHFPKRLVLFSYRYASPRSARSEDRRIDINRVNDRAWKRSDFIQKVELEIQRVAPAGAMIISVASAGSLGSKTTFRVT